MTLARDWNISPPSKVCHATGRAFTDGEKFISVLRETPREWVRLDYSLEGWEKSPHTAEEIASRWQSEFHVRQSAPEPIAKNDVESLLRRLITQGAPEDTAVRYVLAVMLERKKVLKPVDKLERGTRKILVYEHSKTGESFLIEDPRLKLTELEPIQERVRFLLDNPHYSEKKAGRRKHHQSLDKQGWYTWLSRNVTYNLRNSFFVYSKEIMPCMRKSYMFNSHIRGLRQIWQLIIE